MFYITYLSKKNNEIEAFYDNITNSVIMTLSITFSLLIIDFYQLSDISFIVFPFDLLMILFIFFFIPFFYLLMIREKKKFNKTSHHQIQNQNEKKNDIPLKYDIYRKLAHLVVLSIILFYFILGFLLKNVFLVFLRNFPEEMYDTFSPIFIHHGDLMIFTQYLVVFLVGISLIGLLTADFVRILKPDYYPLKPVNRILRKKELHWRLGPHISMAVGCFSIIILFGLFQPIGPLVICTSMTMSIFGDMASNLIGRTIGKKHIRETKKTYEGLFAGIIFAYVSGIIMLIILRFFYVISISGFFLLPLFGALIMGVLDYVNLPIDDNLTYTFGITTILFFIAQQIA